MMNTLGNKEENTVAKNLDDDCGPDVRTQFNSSTTFHRPNSRPESIELVMSPNITVQTISHENQEESNSQIYDEINGLEEFKSNPTYNIENDSAGRKSEVKVSINFK